MIADRRLEEEVRQPSAGPVQTAERDADAAVLVHPLCTRDRVQPAAVRDVELVLLAFAHHLPQPGRNQLHEARRRGSSPRPGRRSCTQKWMSPETTTTVLSVVATPAAASAGP